MKLFIFALFIFTTGNVLASDLKIPQGSYCFQHEIKIEKKKRVEIVRVYNSSGEERLQNLLNSGYSCVPSENKTYICNIFTNGNIREIKDAAENNLSNALKIEFLNLSAEPNLTHKGDSVEIWQIPQEVLFRNKNFKEYQVVINENIQKIHLSEQDAFTWAGESLEYSLNLVKTESRNSYNIYYLSALYSVCSIRRMHSSKM